MALRAILTVVLMSVPQAVSSTPKIWAAVKGGTHAVGVARIAGTTPEVTYWYPASPGGRAARLRDFSVRPEALSQVLAEGGLGVSAARKYLDTSLKARWDAPAETGEFPLVLIGQGNQHDALDQAVLAEIVASHGFVVATAPSPTIASPMQSADDVGPMAQRQAEELLGAAERLIGLGRGDGDRMTVIGHSFGARAALLLAMHDQRVKGLVSLDGGIGTSTAIDSFKKAAWFAPAKATAPILHFYETRDAAMTPDFTLLKSLAARELVLQELKGLEHSHFSTAGFESVVDLSWRRLTGMAAEGPGSLVKMMDMLVSFLRARS